MHEEDKNAPWLKKPDKRHCPPPYLPPVPDCDDQLPVFSRVGRGIKGDSVNVDLVVDEDGHTHLVVDLIDQADGHVIEHHDKIVDGGKLTYGYNLHPFNDPSTFTITFHYEHPSEDPDLDWSWTTPEIPYMWTNEGANEIVGSGIASLFIRKKGEPWRRTVLDNPLPTSHTAAEALTRQEKLIYPVGDMDRYDYNAPDPDDPEKKWTVNLTYGISTERYPTDIDVPNREDLSKILGISTDNIEELTNFYITPTDELPVGMNLKQYIDSRINNAIGDILKKIYGQQNATIGDDGHIDWQAPLDADPDDGTRISVGNLNVYGGDSRTKWIKNHADEETDDVWAR